MRAHHQILMLERKFTARVIGVSALQKGPGRGLHYRRRMGSTVPTIDAGAQQRLTVASAAK
jgi:hypothetical protein